MSGKCCRLYNVFGSGASHEIHSQFMTQSFIHNKGRRVGLLHGAKIRMALWFYAMMQVLCHKDELKATIHTLQFKELVKNENVRGTVRDIENATFLKLCISCSKLCCLPFMHWDLLILTSQWWIKFTSFLKGQRVHWRSQSNSSIVKRFLVNFWKEIQH